MTSNADLPHKTQQTIGLPTLKVVSGVICNAEGLYLIALRPPHVPFPGVWEFPGGKVEADEDNFTALKRELFEEVGVTVTHATPLLNFQHAYPNRIIDMSAWSIQTYEGEAYGAENQAIAWVKAEKLITLPFPEGNRILINYLLTNPPSSL